MAYTQNGLIEAVDYTSIARGYVNYTSGLMIGRIVDQWGPGVDDHGLGQDISDISPPHSILDGGWAKEYATKFEMDFEEFALSHAHSKFEVNTVLTTSSVIPWPIAGADHEYNSLGIYHARVDVGGSEYGATIDTAQVTTIGQLLDSLNTQLGAQGFTFSLLVNTTTSVSYLRISNTASFTYKQGNNDTDLFYDLFYALYNGYYTVGALYPTNWVGHLTTYAPLIETPEYLPPGSLLRTTGESIRYYRQVSLDGLSFEPLAVDTATHVTTGSTVTALQWTALISAIENCSSHAGIIIPKSTAPVAGAIITHITDLENNSAAAYSSSGTTGLPLSDSAATTVTYSTPWGLWTGTETTPGSGDWIVTAEQFLYFHFTVEFASQAHLRYFFNAGGQVKVSFDRTGGSLTLINDEWSALASDCGSVIIGYKDTTKVGGTAYAGYGNGGNIVLPGPGLGGFYRSFNDAQNSSNASCVQFTQTDDVGDYISNSISVETYYDADGSFQGPTKLMIRVRCDNTGGMTRAIDGDTSASVVVSYPADMYITNTWGTATVTGVATLNYAPPAGGIYTEYNGYHYYPHLYTTNGGTDFIHFYAAGIFKLDADMSYIQGINNSQIMCGAVYYDYNGDGSSGGEGRLVVNGIVKHQFTVVPGDKVNDLYLNIDHYITSLLAADMGTYTGYADSIDFSVYTDNLGQVGTYLASTVGDLLLFDTFNTKSSWGLYQPGFTSNQGGFSGNMNVNAMSTVSPYPNIELVGGQSYADRWPEVASSSLYGTDRSAQVALNVNLGDSSAWSYDGNYAHYIQYDLGFSYDTDNALPGLLYNSTSGVLSTTEYDYSVPGALSGVYTQPDKSVYPNGPVARGVRYYPGVEAMSNGGRLGFINSGTEPIKYEQWFSTMAAAAADNRSNPAIASPAVYTLFGDQGQGPGAYDTGLAGNYVRGFAAGIFSIGIDLSYPSAIPDQFIMCGVIYTGDETSGSGRIVVNGVVIDSFTNTGSQTVTMSWETALSGVSIDVLNGLAGYCDTLSLTAGANTITFNGSYTQGGSGPFDTKNVKFGVFIDQVTGAGTEVYVPNKEYTFKPPCMFVAHPYTQPFDWTTLASDILVDWETYYNVDRRYSIGMVVNLGGYAPAWTTTDAPMNGFVSFDLGYTYANINAVDQLVDGGSYNVIDGISTNHTNTFLANSGNYYQGDAIVAGVPAYGSGPTLGNLGIRFIEGVEATNIWGGSAIISVPNFGMPFLYEQWFRPLPPNVGV